MKAKSQVTELGQVDRKSLLSVLSTISPATRKDNTVPAMACFCFDGEHVFAFDDVIAMRASNPIPKLKGGLAAESMLTFLKSTVSKAAKISLAGDVVTFRCGRSTLRLPLVSLEEAVFPTMSVRRAEMSCPKSLINAVSLALPSMMTSPTEPELLGMCLQVNSEKGRVLVNCTNNITACRARASNVKVTTAEGVGSISLTASPRFSQLLASMSRQHGPKVIRLFSDDKVGPVTWVQSVFTSGVQLFGKTLDIDNSAAYDGIFKQVSGKLTKRKLIDVPSRLRGALIRAGAAMSSADSTRTPTEITIDAEGRGTIKTESHIGRAMDTNIGFEGHKNLTCQVFASDLLPVLDFADKMHLNTKLSVVWLRGGRADYVVAMVAE